MSKIIELGKREQRLINDLRLEVKRANQRLVRLERKFGKGTWASKKLEQRLNNDLVVAWTDAGRVKLNKRMTLTQLKATSKAVKLFLNSKTSTASGIKSTIKNTKIGLKKVLGDSAKNIEDSEIETIFDLMSDNDMRDLSRFIPPSDLAILIQDARENNDSENQFINRVKNYIDFGNDVDMKNKLTRIYNKYIYR